MTQTTTTQTTTTQTTTRRPTSAEPVGGAQTPPAMAFGRRARLVGVDATRGVALLGMMAVHSLYESDAAGRPTLSFSIFGGRAAATFAVLAGVGIAFMTGRRRVHPSACLDTAAALGMRALAIGAIGLALGNTDGSLAVVILPYYAVMFMLAIPLVLLPTWTVAAIGVATAAGMPALTHIVLPHLPTPTLDNHSFGYLVDHPVRMLSELSITGEYPALPWMAYLCAGLAVGRLALTRTRVAVGLLASGLMLTVAASAASSILLNQYGGLERIWAAQPGSVLTAAGTTDLLTFGDDGTAPTSTWWWLAIDARHTSTPFDLMGTTGTAIALLGVMLLAGHITRPATVRRLITVVQKPLAAAGALTLSFYTAHVMFINSDYDTYDATTGYIVQVAAVLPVGLAWRVTVGRGPLEGLVAALSTRARRWATTASRRPPSPLAAVTASIPGQNSRDTNEVINKSAGSASRSGRDDDAPGTDAVAR
jgi:uncharacterized membrane protein